MLAFLLSKPDGWKVRVSHLVGTGDLGKDGVKSTLDELEECGYIVRTESARVGGRFDGSEIEVYETPRSSPGRVSRSGWTGAVEPAPVNPPLVKTDSVNTDKEVITKDNVHFANAWEHYPRKVSKKLALEKFTATCRRGEDPLSLIAATKAYAEHVRTEQTEDRYIMLPATFYGPHERWKDYVPEPELEPPAWLLEVAAVYDDWESSGRLTLMPTVPRHPQGGLVDREGRRYTYDPNTNQRVYS
jgi:hypothetical protein